MNALRCLALALISAALNAFPAAAQDCFDYTTAPHWIAQLETPVWTSDVLVEGDLVYLAARTAGIIIADISDPWHPVQVGHLDYPDWTGTADRLALSGNHLFVTDGSGRLLQVVDVSDPIAPSRVTQVATDVYPDGLALLGDFLYVAVQATGVEIYDITNPAQPQPVGTLPVTLAHNVDIEGELLFTTSLTNTVAIHDLVDPANPALLATVTLPEEVEAYDVEVLGDLAYVAGALGTWIMDITDPTAPALAGSIPGGCTSLTIADGHAFLMRFRVEVFDLANPLAPVPVVKLSQPEGSGFSFIRRVVLQDGFVFAAADDAGLMVADCRQMVPPPLIGTLDPPSSVYRVHRDNSYTLATAGSGGLLVLDLEDPGQPQQIGLLPSQDARAVTTVGDLAYLADGGDGLKIVDLSNPETPQQIGHLDTYSRVAAGLVWRDDLIYLAAGLNGLMVIDVTTPAAPVLLGQVATPGNAMDVVVAGSHAFVADHNEGLQVVDISVPEAPFVAASLPLPGRQGTVLLDGTTLYLGGEGTGLRVIDVSDPTTPEVTGWLPFQSRDLVLDGHLLLAAGHDGVTLIDRTDPSAMTSVGFMPTWEAGHSVAVADSFLVLAGDQILVAPRPCVDISGVGDAPPELTVWAQLSGHPNPFNPRITIAFTLGQAQRASLEVYDLAGRRIAELASGEFAAREHRVEWDGRDSQGKAAAAGCFFVLLRGQAHTQSVKVMLVR
jgi:hypothetical protein